VSTEKYIAMRFGEEINLTLFYRYIHKLEGVDGVSLGPTFRSHNPRFQSP